MEKYLPDEFLWELKYRPQSLKDMLLPAEIKNFLQDKIKDGNIPNLGLWSKSPGLGKTSLANAIAGELDSETLMINASEENGINLVRTTIKQFVDSVSFFSNTKLCILDEVDNTTSDFQKAFRSFLENNPNARFILTANYKSNILEPVRSRLYQIDFDEFYSMNKKEMMLLIFDRMKFILNNENVSFQDTDVQHIIKIHYPSMRDMIITLQNSIVDNKLIVTSNMVNFHSNNLKLVEYIKDKKWDESRDIVSQIPNPGIFYNHLFRTMDTLMNEESQKHLIIILDEQIYRLNNSRDPEINLTSTVAKIMLNKNIILK